MPNKKISELPPAGTLTGVELAEAVQGGINVQTTLTDIANLAGGSVANASETVKGVVEEATDAETQAGTATGGTGAKLAVTPAKLATWWTWVKTQIQTFAAQITFTAAPRFSSTTASRFLRVDSNKDLTSVASASVSDLVTGTDDVNPMTSLSMKNFRDLVELSVSESGGTISINCNSKQEVVALCSSTVSGNVTISLSNTTNLTVLHLFIPVTGSNKQLTFPSTTRMARSLEVSSGDGWYQSTKILQISSAGTADLHEFSLFKAGSVFKLNYDGPARA